jgi:hypothetical protein
MRKFIPFPWRVGEIIVNHISHLYEFAGQFDQIGLKEAKYIDGFDPNGLFSTHMSMVGHSSYFYKFEQFQEGGGGDNQNLLDTSVDKSLNDIKELYRTNECYRKKGREVTNKTPNFPSVSQRSTHA